MRNYLLATLVLFASPSFAEEAINLDGNYECQGNEIGTNSAFKCQMNMKKTGETYASTATCDDGNSYSGTGIYDQNTRRLSTGFINPKKADETGVAVTEVKPDGSLSTLWTYLNQTTTGHTTCTKQPNKTS